MSYTYVNPVVAVLLGIFLLHERPVAAEFAGMGCIVVAVFLMTTAQVKAKDGRAANRRTRADACGVAAY